MKKYNKSIKIRIQYTYNKQYEKYLNDNDLDFCVCGHQYHRHFDSYDDDPSPLIGCKYCDCYNFIPAIPLLNELEFNEFKNIKEYYLKSNYIKNIELELRARYLTLKTNEPKKKMNRRQRCSTWLNSSII